MDFPDPDTELARSEPEQEGTRRERRSSRSARGERPGRRRGSSRGGGGGGPRQQVMARRAVALGGGLIILILLVLGVKGCLDARKSRALEDYARDVTQVVDETQNTGEQFFQLFEDPGNLSVTDFTNEIDSNRSAFDGYLSRVQKLSVPGDMSDPQESLETVYELRASAMNVIAQRMPTALGEGGRQKAIGAIANQMQVLAAADVLYTQITAPAINGVLADNGISGNDVPKSVLVPDPAEWIDAGGVEDALSGVSGSSTSESSDPNATHGTGIFSVTVGGTTLDPGIPVTVSGSTVDVQVQNQGSANESGIDVSVSVGGTQAEETIDSIAPGETQTVSIPLTPAPSGEQTLDVSVAAVDGEQVTTNNEASYTVTFE